MPRRFSTPISLLAALGLLAGIALAGPAFANPNYPTAAEVEAAKRDVTEKKKMIDRIEKIIADQEVEVEALNREASIKAEIYNNAREELLVVERKVKVLEKQTKKATQEAADAEAQLGQIASEMMRNGSGGTSLNLFLNPGDADNLLYQLGAQEKLAQQTQLIYQKSLEKQRLAKSLTDELASAQAELAQKAEIAQKAFDDATKAANAVEAKVAANKRQNRIFYNQLASLRNTASDLERQRQEGLAWERRQAAGTSMPDAPELYKVGPPNQAKVETVVAFARAQLGKPYVLGAAGPNAWDCSGLTMKAYAAAGIYVGTHSVSNQFINAMDKRQLVPVRDVEAGDLVFWSTSTDHLNRSYAYKYHIGIYIGGGLVIDAPNPSKPVRIIELNLRLGELVPYAARPSA
ncbi:MAG: NlpC/P60 family protein [Actinomycetota bacterium]